MPHPRDARVSPVHLVHDAAPHDGKSHLDVPCCGGQVAPDEVAGPGERLTPAIGVCILDRHRADAGVVSRDELQQALRPLALVDVHDEGVEAWAPNEKLDVLGGRGVEELFRNETAVLIPHPWQLWLAAVHPVHAEATADYGEGDLDVARRDGQENLCIVPRLRALPPMAGKVEERYVHGPHAQEVARHLQHRLRPLRCPGALRRCGDP
mmetsp:Transcript_20333/g.58949  ORF Transcript_20333/g.58949 Transcript_20333/m.58949 type:complete len:209 (-) Transcript_20333:342-968(-)